MDSYPSNGICITEEWEEIRRKYCLEVLQALWAIKEKAPLNSVIFSEVYLCLNLHMFAKHYTAPTFIATVNQLKLPSLIQELGSIAALYGIVIGIQQPRAMP